ARRGGELVRGTARRRGFPIGAPPSDRAARGDRPHGRRASRHQGVGVRRQRVAGDGGVGHRRVPGAAARATRRPRAGRGTRARPASWFSDALIRRIGARIGDAQARASADAAILARGRVLLVRARALMALSVTLVVAGAAAGAGILVRRRLPRVAAASLPPLWGPGDGYALFVRCLGAPQAIALVAFVVLRRETGLGTAIGMAADLPIFLWVAYYLGRRDSSMREAFGLWPRPGGWAPLLGAALVLIALTSAGDTLIEIASNAAHLRTHWADGFTEE